MTSALSLLSSNARQPSALRIGSRVTSNESCIAFLGTPEPAPIASERDGSPYPAAAPPSRGSSYRPRVNPKVPNLPVRCGRLCSIRPNQCIHLECRGSSVSKSTSEWHTYYLTFTSTTKDTSTLIPKLFVSGSLVQSLAVPDTRV